AGWAICFSRCKGLAQIVLLSGIASTLVLLAYATWKQSALYEGPTQLYQAALADNPSSWLAHNNLGMSLTDRGRFQEAASEFEQSLRLKPDYARAENNWGVTLAKLGQ